MNLSTEEKQFMRLDLRSCQAGVGGEDGLGVQGWQMQITTFRMDKQQGPNVQHRKLYSIYCDKIIFFKKNVKKKVYHSGNCSESNKDQDASRLSWAMRII